MRSDAANLLSRLGQNNFKYKEFRDNFADMELWPLFEALIRDPRVSGEAGHTASMPHAPASEAEGPDPVPSRPGGLFGRYAQPETQPAPQSPHDVRSLLQQLNDRVATGDL
jgi:hypothetical protein